MYIDEKTKETRRQLETEIDGLKEWEWGHGDDDALGRLIKELSVNAGAVVMRQIWEDLHEHPALLNFSEDDTDVILTKLSGDHFLVNFSLKRAIEYSAEDFDSDEKKALTQVLRRLADEIEKSSP